MDRFNFKGFFEYPQKSPQKIENCLGKEIVSILGIYELIPQKKSKFRVFPKNPRSDEFKHCPMCQLGHQGCPCNPKFCTHVFASTVNPQKRPVGLIFLSKFQMQDLLECGSNWNVGLINMLNILSKKKNAA